MKKAAALLLLVFAAAALVACGGSGSSTSSSTSSGSGAAAAREKIEIEADPNGEVAYTKATLSAKPGEITVVFTNPQGVPHDVAIQDSSGTIDGQTETVAKGSASTTVNLKPGVYHYFSTVPGEREAGMEGTLTVK